jgi:hypothetical protein
VTTPILAHCAGTNNGKNPSNWNNPADLGLVLVNFSSYKNDSDSSTKFLGRTGCRCLTDDTDSNAYVPVTYSSFCDLT